MLGFFPTPFQPLYNLSRRYPGYDIFIKRDDQTGLASGGNKTRKLEYLVKEAIDSKCDTVITAGAQQSNHCRQTAAACAAAGLECHLLLGGSEPDKYEGNLLLSHILGAEIHFTGEHRKGEDTGSLKKELENVGKRVFIIPYGGSNLTGALGYVNAVKELRLQLLESGVAIDYIFFASSSGGTQAGLMLGMELFGVNAELMPVGIDKTGIEGHSLEENVYKIVVEGKRMLKLENNYKPDDIKVIRGYDTPGYGVVTGDEISAIREMAEAEGIILDPVYTGRAFYGMLDHLRNNRIEKGANILFWHTGGFPSNFCYADKFLHNDTAN